MHMLDMVTMNHVRNVYVILFVKCVQVSMFILCV